MPEKLKAATAHFKNPKGAHFYCLILSGSKSLLVSGQCQKVFVIFTSIVVLDITAGGFHRGVTARAPPAQLAHTVPAVVTQSAPAISVAQTRTTLCEK